MEQKENYRFNTSSAGLRLAILDMYDGTPNLGMNNILEILTLYPGITVDCFDVRGKCEVPGLNYDIYISSGGPGSPLLGDGIWERAYYSLLDRLWLHNQKSIDKKYVFFICHSFQMICLHLGLGEVLRRKKESFGIYPVHKTDEGKNEEVFSGLSDPFYVADFREWQVVRPNYFRINKMGFKIMAMEKLRPHVDLERAIMAIRFSPEWFGTQFHPEADPDGMLYHFSETPKKDVAIAKKGSKKYDIMMQLLRDPEKLVKTYDQIIPSFLNHAIQRLSQQKISVNIHI
ncbi:MAG TPA: GMP synthase [Saprospiraceae bacterium]|nr:GMP synthase [Saprospiraceae bacterium]